MEFAAEEREKIGGHEGNGGGIRVWKLSGHGRKESTMLVIEDPEPSTSFVEDNPQTTVKIGEYRSQYTDHIHLDIDPMMLPPQNYYRQL